METHELRVLLDEAAQRALGRHVVRLLLEEERDLGAAAERVTAGVLGDRERAVRHGLPHVLLVVVVLGHDAHLVGDEVDRVEADCAGRNQLPVASQGTDAGHAPPRSPPNWPMRDRSPPEAICSMNAAVPDLATVPRLLMRSCLVMPTPRSRMTIVCASVSPVMRISRSRSSPLPSSESSASERKRILSSASDAFEISSRRKISVAADEAASEVHDGNRPEPHHN